MKRKEVLSGVPDDLKARIDEDFRRSGAARVTSRQAADGTWTITAWFDDVPVEAVAPPATTSAATRKRAGRARVGRAGAAAMPLEGAPGEPERPSRREIELADAAQPQLYYPSAQRNVMGEMVTRGRYRRGHPEGAVVHFTAGRDDPRSDIRSGLDHGFCYFVIAPNGDVYQNFPLDRWGYHAGASAWPSLGTGVSQYLVGIEICCAGRVRDLGNGMFRPWYNEADFLAPSGRVPNPANDLPASSVRTVKARHNMAAGSYEAYTAMQEASLTTLLRWLQRNNPAVFDFDLVLGHDEVAPGRKTDPGGALSMSMPEFRAMLAGAA